MEVYRFQWTGAAWNIMSWLRLYSGSLYILLNLPCNCHLCIYWNTWYFSKFQCSLISPWRENSVLHKVFCSGRNLLYCLGFFQPAFYAIFRKATLKSNAVLGLELCLQLILPPKKGLIFTKIIYIFWYLLSTHSSH